MRFLFTLTGILLAYVAFIIGPPLHRSFVVLGAFRRTPLSTLSADEILTIEDTIHCEDLHYYAPSSTIFTTCEDNISTRFRWFPPLAIFDDPGLGNRSRGSIHVIDPKTLTSRRLLSPNFPPHLPFVTHGIDLHPDPSSPSTATYIFAINHLPHPTLPSTARSQIEIFHHVLGSSTATHIRSVWHPLLRTPNDLFAASPTRIYATNDHRYTHGRFWRTIEDVYSNAKWTDTIRLDIDLDEREDDAKGVVGSVAIDGMHNNNGLGHGRTETEILIASATGGVLSIGEILENGNISVVDEVKSESVIDNPSYFRDERTGRSGFVLPGLARGVDLEHTKRDPEGVNPVMVWYAWEQEVPLERWGRRLLFEDDGSKIRSASAAVLVPVEAEEGKAWLFVTGFQAEGIIVVKVDV